MNIKDFLSTLTKNNLELLDNINKSITNLDNSNLSILENDFNGSQSDLKEESLKKVAKSIADSTGFFEKRKVLKEILTIQSKLESLGSRLSDKDLYTNTCKLGIKIIKEDFSNKEDIDNFKKKYDECQYYKDRLIEIFE